LWWLVLVKYWVLKGQSVLRREGLDPQGIREDTLLLPLDTMAHPQDLAWVQHFWVVERVVAVVVDVVVDAVVVDVVVVVVVVEEEVA